MEASKRAGSLIERFFNAEEVDRLELDLPRLHEWSRYLLVPFRAHRISSARLFWMNRRWFFERGIAIDDAATERRASNWLLEEFGYVIPRKEDPPDAFANEARRTLYAD